MRILDFRFWILDCWPWNVTRRLAPNARMALPPWPCRLATKAAVGLAFTLPACDSSVTPPQDRQEALVSVAGWSQARAERRAYDGAPPVIPHMRMGAACLSCHNQTGIQFGEMGFAPPMPHAVSPNPGMFANCEQCHVYVDDGGLFAESTFEGLRQDLRRGPRFHDYAPPVLPHPVFMRENCLACHTGPAAREEIRCTHPERVQCLQCHVPVVESTEFARVNGRS
jgi:nitrate reductase cytochrome c-type subunit